MPGATRDSAQTKATILAAARLRFGADGYERTTIRAVAGAAGVDPALVMHYFQNKDGLFRAAARLDLALPDLAAVAPDRFADVLLPAFFRVWNPDGAFLGLLRAAATNPTAAQALVSVFGDQVAPVLGAVARDRIPQRAALVGAQLLGIAVSRFVVGVPPMVDMTEAELIRWVRPVLAHYLTGPAPRGT